jgi:uncharacterized membrane protein YdbT with pleckstrin-like domain
MADGYLQSLLGDGEKVLHTTRRHWLVLVLEILPETALALGLIILVTLVLALVPVAAPAAALGYLLLLLPLVSLARDLLDWRNRMFVITTHRVIYVQGIINKDVTDSSLEKVNDVKLEQPGWGRVLNYGDVEILTASELGVNKFSRIADPISFKKAMLNAKHRLETNRGEDLRPPASAARGPLDVPALIAQLDGLRQHGLLTDAEFQEKKKELLGRL